MGKPILYLIDYSTPARTVLLVAQEIGLELETREIVLFNKDHLKPDFLKINPHHTIPTLDDNGHVVWDSHAICKYLICKYAKNHPLYPDDIAIQSQIDRCLFFDAGVLYPALRAALYGGLYEGNAEFTPNQFRAIHTAYDLLNVLFDENKYLLENQMTLADLSCVASVVQLNAIVPLDASKHSKILEWMKRFESLPNYFEINVKPDEPFIKVLHERMEQNRK